MSLSRLPTILILACGLSRSAAFGETLNLRGRVVMDDGSQPGRPILVSRYCAGMDGALQQVPASSKTGEYYIRLNVDYFGTVFTQITNGGCYLEAEARGFRSTRIDLTDRKSIHGFRIGDIVLSKVSPGANPLQDVPVPASVRKQWASALKLLEANSWQAAEVQLRALVQAAPNLAAVWIALGTAYQNDGNSEAASRAFEKAVQLEPKRLSNYSMLLAAEMNGGAWEEALKTSQKLMAADTKHQYLDAHIQNAAALYAVKNYPAAIDRINEAIRLDKRLEFPRAECILGLILEARGDLAGAGTHLRHYIENHPRAMDVDFAKERLANLGKRPPADVTPLVRADMRLAGSAEASVPGGLQAFATLARMNGTPGYGDFFIQYCRAISGNEGSGGPTLESGNYLLEFAAVVPELELSGERSEGRSTVRLATDTEEHRKTTAHVLELFGWRLAQEGSAFDLAPGNQQRDGIRQRFPSLFGIDELEMRNAIAGGTPFQFDVPIESARLFGGATWAALLKSTPGELSQPVNLFLRDIRFARAYAGLASMDPDAAQALVKSMGLATLVLKHSAALDRYGDVLRLAGGRVDVPGGPEAAKLWSAAVGEDPKNPGAFLRALFEKDQGRLLPFYFDVFRADEAHRRFVLASPARFQAFFHWYLDSGTIDKPDSPDRWQSAIVQRIPLDAAGNPDVPGGIGAWPDHRAGSGEFLFSLPPRPLAAILQLQERRHTRLDAGSVKLLTEHFEDWRSLQAYFEKLPGLGQAEFQSLADLQSALTATPHPEVVLGEFHSLVELIVLASEAGSLDSARAALEFGRATAALHSDDSPAAVLAVLREMAGNAADLDDAVPGAILRLDETRRASFERVKELQNVPRLASLGKSPDPARLSAALSGIVYAALLDPHYQVVADDPGLLSKHNFLPKTHGGSAGLFAASDFVRSNTAPGSFLVGGFGRFREVTRALDRSSSDDFVPTPAASPDIPDAVSPEPGGTGDGGPHIKADFSASGRLVEVYATITDAKGNYIDDLKAPEFSVLEEGQKRPAFAFEDHNEGVSIALLFDTTGSMEATLPSLKAAALKLIGDLRPTDSVAVYGFNDRVSEYQRFTTDKTVAGRAVLKAYPAGATALYDALLRVSDDLALRAGKKVILVFTDGDDNSSFLTSETAVFRAKMRGIPIYSIAQGQAVERPALLRQLADISRATGGSSFVIHKPQEIAGVFRKISNDLKHGYLLAFEPRPGEDRGWRRIEVVVRGKGLKVRAREGYFLEQ